MKLFENLSIDQCERSKSRGRLSQSFTAVMHGPNGWLKVEKGAWPLWDGLSW